MKATDPVDDTEHRRNAPPVDSYDPQTTPSKAEFNETILSSSFKGDDNLRALSNAQLKRVWAEVEALITTNLTQAILPHEPGDLDKQVDAWLRKNNVGVNQFAEFVGIFAWMNAEVSNRAIAHALTQHNEALLAKLPEKTYNPNHAAMYRAGYNAAIDQVTAIIKRAGITGSGK